MFAGKGDPRATVGLPGGILTCFAAPHGSCPSPCFSHPSSQELLGNPLSLSQSSKFDFKKSEAFSFSDQ